MYLSIERIRNITQYFKAIEEAKFDQRIMLDRLRSYKHHQTSALAVSIEEARNSRNYYLRRARLVRDRFVGE